MRRLILPVLARHDLVGIDAYIAHSSGSTEVARAFTGSLRDRCSRLATLPGTLGTPRPELGNDLRSIVHRGYVILFRYGPGTVRILRVIEGHRDVARLLGPQDH